MMTKRKKTRMKCHCGKMEIQDRYWGLKYLNFPNRNSPLSILNFSNLLHHCLLLFVGRLAVDCCTEGSKNEKLAELLQVVGLQDDGLLI